MSFIPEPLYKEILNNTVNLCVDVLLRYDHRYLFIKRLEEPCKNVFWPSGGRIHKSESAETAARRKIHEEIGIEFTSELKSIGFYEDTYEVNNFGEGPYHTLSIVFLGHLTKEQYKNIKLDSTSSEYKLNRHMPERFKVKTFSDFGRPFWYMESARQFM